MILIMIIIFIIIKNVNCARFARKSILPDTKNVTVSRLWNSRLTIEGGGWLKSALTKGVGDSV